MGLEFKGCTLTWKMKPQFVRFDHQIRVLSTGDTEARVTIYRHFQFLVEKIGLFENEEAAREVEYEIAFQDQAISTENSVLLY